MDEASVRTYSHAPITLGHPDVKVDSQNWKDLAKGEVSTEAEWRDNKLRLPLIVKDAAAIAAIKTGTRELSAGYTCNLDLTDGVTPDGEAYDAVQRNIRVNHLAIVPRARGGSQLRIGDGAKTWGASPLSDAGKEVFMTLRKIMVDGLEVEVTDAGATAIAKLQKTIADMEYKAKEKEEDDEKKMAAKEVEIAKKDAQIADLQGKVLDEAALDKLVADRADLISRAKALDAKVVTDGKSAAEIKKAVVVSRLGDTVKDKSAAYIDAAFDLLGDEKADPLKGAIGATVQSKVSDRAALYSEFTDGFAAAHPSMKKEK
jgi:hypothetical protein